MGDKDHQVFFSLSYRYIQISKYSWNLENWNNLINSVTVAWWAWSIYSIESKKLDWSLPKWLICIAFDGTINEYHNRLSQRLTLQRFNNGLHVALSGQYNPINSWYDMGCYCLVHPGVRDKRRVSEIDLSQTRNETAFWWRHNGPVTSQLTNRIEWPNYP